MAELDPSKGLAVCGMTRDGGLGRPVAHYLVLVVSGLALLVAEPVATQVAAAARLPPHLKALPQPSIPQAPSKIRSTTLQRYRAPAQAHKDTRSAEPAALRLTPDAAHPWPVPKDPPCSRVNGSARTRFIFAYLDFDLFDRHQAFGSVRDRRRHATDGLKKTQ